MERLRDLKIVNCLVCNFLTCFLLFYVTLSADALTLSDSSRSGWNFPKNTLLSFAKSLEMGCDALALDVQVTKMELLLYHPDGLNQ
ncbi:MAG: glycerophosphodiester phosphodiesterase family protein [Parachlamydiaceae bacterium]